VQDVSKEAGEGIVQLRDLLVDSGKPLQKQAEMANFELRYPVAVDEVTKGSLAVVWGAGIQEGSTSQVIGSEKVVGFSELSRPTLNVKSL
jgi:hypothetical protein